MKHAAGFLRLLRLLHGRIDLPGALETLRRSLAARDERFLQSARDLIYANPRSPYRRLLARSGCAFADLAHSVRSSGIESTLARLSGEGVFISFEEYKGRTPIVRGGLVIETRPGDFDPPDHRGGIHASTSGSRSAGTTAVFDWDLIAEHATTEIVLDEVHGVLDEPKALWLPLPPGLAGIHAVLMHAKMRRRFDRWFTQVAPGSVRSQAVSRSTVRAGTAAIRFACALHGCRIPRPELVESDEAEVIARWISQEVARGRRPLLRSYASAAVRVAESAMKNGLEIRGATVLAGGEPLTDSRRAYVERSGMGIFARYSAADAGLVGASCHRRESTDDMHVYSDRFAVITRDDGDPGDLLLTTLSPRSPKILLNTSIGDTGRVAERPCDCLFGAVGMSRRVFDVRSSEKITHEGMNVSLVDLDRVAGEVILRAGGSPADYQFWSEDDDRGITSLKLAVSPRVPLGGDLERELLEQLGHEVRGGALAAEIWTQGRTIEVVRSEPRMTGAKKLHPLVRIGPAQK